MTIERIVSMLISALFFSLRERSVLNKNKISLLVAIMVTITILTVGGVRITQIKSNYQANKLILEACVDNGGTALVGQKHFWSLTAAACEEN